MTKSKTPTLELFEIIRSAISAHENLYLKLKLLRKKRLISPQIWREKVVSSQRNLSAAVEAAWRHLHKKASARDYPELISEEDVMREFGISNKTLYRRRRKRELPYIKDKDGMIWYPLYDLLEYVLAAKPQKSGRPRKF